MEMITTPLPELEKQWLHYLITAGEKAALQHLLSFPVVFPMAFSVEVDHCNLPTQRFSEVLSTGKDNVLGDGVKMLLGVIASTYSELKFDSAKEVVSAVSEVELTHVIGCVAKEVPFWEAGSSKITMTITTPTLSVIGLLQRNNWW